MSDQNAFNEAVRFLRSGRKSNLEIVSELDEMLGKDKSSWEILADAEKYLKELQTRAFDAAVDAFKRGETTLSVEQKLRSLGFQSWDAMTVAGRAQEKAAAELALETKPE